MSNPPASRQGSNVDLSTLMIAAVASGVAAYLTSRLWPGGTLVSASLTPVIVALVKEGLTRTSDVTTRRVRDLTTGRTVEVEVPRERAEPAEPFDPLAPAGPPPPTQTGDTVTVHRDGALRRKRWRVAIVTGLLAFVVAATVVTVPQLIANSAGARGGGTTYFGGGPSRDDADDGERDREEDPTPTPTATPAQTPGAAPTPGAEETPAPTPEATPTAEPTETPTPTPTPTPSPTAAPTPDP